MSDIELLVAVYVVSKAYITAKRGRIDLPSADAAHVRLIHCKRHLTQATKVSSRVCLLVVSH